MRKPSIVSLFSGAGGMDLGFITAGYNTVWANDIDKWAVETYRTNISNHIVCKDIAEVSSSDIPDVDVVTGGFPCQDFSILGGSVRQGIKAERGKLYKQFLRVVKDKRPAVFVAENVKGILSANNGLAIKVIRHDLEYLDTDRNVFLESNTEKEKAYVVFIDVYNFADYCVPQTRERVLFIGIRKDVYEKGLKNDYVFRKPQPVCREYVPCKKVFDGKVLYYDKNVKEIPYNNELQKLKPETIKMLRMIPEGGNFKDLPPEYAIQGLMSNIYRRLHRDKPSPTIIANGGGGTWGYHYEEPRSLTNRERARLQSFPDWFVFKGSMSEVRKQIGNAVPPLGIMPVAFELKNYLIDGYDKDKDEYYKKYLEIVKRI